MARRELTGNEAVICLVFGLAVGLLFVLTLTLGTLGLWIFLIAAAASIPLWLNLKHSMALATAKAFEQDVLSVIRNKEDPERWGELCRTWYEKNCSLGALLRSMQLLKLHSYRCMHSKNPETARSHMDDLDVQWTTNREALRNAVSPEVFGEVEAIVLTCRSEFPWRSRINEAHGLIDRAVKLKTPRGRLKYLRPADIVIDEAAQLPGCSSNLVDQARRRLTEVEAF